MVSITEATALDEADRATAAELARAYIEASGGNADRACHALAYRALRFARSTSAGLLRHTIESILRADYEALARETTRLGEPFAPLEDQAQVP
jgi:hypothetical protein